MSDAIDKRSKKDEVGNYMPKTRETSIKDNPVTQDSGFFEQGISRGSIRGFRIGEITTQSRTANKSIIVTIGDEQYELLAYKA